MLKNGDEFQLYFHCPPHQSVITKLGKDHLYIYKTRMKTFIKTKFTKSDDQTNIDKYRVAANITENHIMSKLIILRIINPVSFKKFMKK